ncbi:hypothetical protein DSO57_1038282 [Entomophthora muscae]|uniref:Uncharacterized protein n=1 Tax=Entomophthora muscae TaxID=34485 RepID=A0ACC2T9H1_9FUNG|nr:hypothetical protein DSO57_1038282 [Entomophthora muscae]
MPQNLGVAPVVSKTETVGPSQCPEFYVQDTLILSQDVYLELFWLGLIILLNPIYEALLVVNHQLHVGLGSGFPPLGDCFLLFVHFCHILVFPVVFIGCAQDHNKHIFSTPVQYYLFLEASQSGHPSYAPDAHPGEAIYQDGS